MTAPSVAPTASPAILADAPAGAGETRRNRDGGMFGDAILLATSSALTAGLGMVFWAVATRQIAPERMGVETAVLSVVTATAVVIGGGAGDALTSLLPRLPRVRTSLLAQAQRNVVLVGLAAGAVASLLAQASLPAVRGDIATLLLAFVAVPIWARFLQQDYAMTAMGRARWLPFENGLSSLLKIALLPLCVAVAIPRPVLVATILPALIAILTLTPAVRGLATRGEAQARAAQPPDEPYADHVTQARTRLREMSTRTTAASALTLGSLTLLPFAVTSLAGPTQGALFALCLSIVASLDFLGSALGVSLVVHAARRPEEAGRLARQAFTRIFVVILLAGSALVALVPLAVGLLGPEYLDLDYLPVVILLAAGSLARTPFVVWAALCRSRGELGPLLTINAIAAAFMYAVLAVLAPAFGARGAAGALLTAQLVLTAGGIMHTWWRRRNLGGDEGPRVPDDAEVLR